MHPSDALQTASDVVDHVAALTQVEWDAVEPSELPQAAAAVAKARAMLDAAMLDVTEQLQTIDVAAETGWASAKDLLTYLTGGHKGAGGGLVRTAQQTHELPAVREALASGEVSMAQAKVMGQRVATLPRVPELWQAAAEQMLRQVRERGYDATDLDRAFRDVVRDLDPDGALLGADLDKERQERGAHHARHLAFSPDTLGGVRIRGYATVEDVEFIKSCLMPLAAPQTTEPGACGGDPALRGKHDTDGRRLDPGCPDPICVHDGSDPRDHGVRMLDALVEACRRLTATDSLPHSHGTSARIVVTMDYDDLRDQTSPAGDGHLPSDERLSATAVRRLACDAEIIPAVLGTDGEILDVGRTQRLVTTAIWHALILRDRHCAFPGCTRPPITCDAHHITHWADGGSTSLDNMVLLCRRHHTLTHHSPWTVSIDPDTRRPVWRRPPEVDINTRMTYIPATGRHPAHAA